MLAIAALGLAGCSNPGSGTVYAPTVYTAGYCIEGMSQMPCYWTGTTKTDLLLPSTANYGVAKDIFVSSGKIHVVGYYQEKAGAVPAHLVPIYWHDGTYDILDNDGTNTSYAVSVYVDGGTTYVAGTRVTSGATNVPCYWSVTTTGHNQTDLPTTGAASAFATSICVSGGTVYVAGYYTSVGVACYWYTGATGVTLSDLPAAAGATASGIDISGGTVYVSGSWIDTTRTACYWTGDGTRVPLLGYGPADTWSATGICVSGGTIYTCGACEASDGTGPSCYWTATTQTNLDGGNENNRCALAIDTIGSTPYVAGFYTISGSYVPCYWEGTTPHALPAGTGIGEAVSIFVE
jgi:hypothetical protein